MDVGSILVAAIFGGIFGGIGGVIANPISKRFPVKPQLITIVCGILGVALSMAATPIFKNTVGVIASDNSPAPQASSDATVARIEKELRSTSTLMRVTAEEWPDEYMSFVKKLAALDGRSEQAIANRLANEFTANLRKSNSQLALYASDAGLRDYFRDYQAFLSEVKSRDGDDLCAAMLSQGPAALGSRAQDYFEQLDLLGAATMNLLLDGRDRKEQGTQSAPDVSDADIGAFDVFLVDRTGVADLVLKLQSGTGDDICDKGILVMKALGEFAPDQPAGHALRTATFRNIASF